MGALEQADALLNLGPNTTQLDDVTKAALAKQNQSLTTPTTEALLKGVGQPGEGLLTPTQSYNYSTGLGGNAGDSGKQVLDAINQRNQKRSTEYVNTLKRTIAMNQPANDEGRLKQAGQNLGQAAQVQLSNYKIQKQYDLDKQRLELYKAQQKDGILASILGVIGTIGGVALGAVTGGAAAPLIGAAIGGAAGKTASSFTSQNTFGGGGGPSLFKS